MQFVDSNFNYFSNPKSLETNVKNPFLALRDHRNYVNHHNFQNMKICFRRKWKHLKQTPPATFIYLQHLISKNVTMLWWNYQTRLVRIDPKIDNANFNISSKWYFSIGTYVKINVACWTINFDIYKHPHEIVIKYNKKIVLLYKVH